MKTLILTPNGWPCSLRECPTGLFVQNGKIGFKTADHQLFNMDGVAYWSKVTKDKCERKGVVQPVKSEWKESEAGK